MNIKTKPFQLGRRKYYRVLTGIYFRKRWWIFLVVLAVAVYIFLEDWDDLLAWLMIIFAILYPAISMISLYFQVYSKKNKLSEYERYFVIRNKYIEGFLTDEEEGEKINYSEFQTAVHSNGYYFLYLSKDQFLYLPDEAFYSETDREQFESILKEKGLMKKKMK